MGVEFEILKVFSASPQAVYHTWLDSEGHAAMIGSSASASRVVGGEFMAHDGYNTGTNLELMPAKLIRQAWRTQECDGSDQDTEPEIALEPEGAGPG